MPHPYLWRFFVIFIYKKVGQDCKNW
jgi:hypothetical protein